jgi:uncharacterized protein (TIGR01319 family)
MIAVCVDVGSTFTKASAVSLPDGELIATSEHPTTVDTDVLHGLDAAVAALGVAPDHLYVCSSAGGGLRLAVVGYEPLVTAEAGRRVGLSAGARVVHVASGRLDRDGIAALRHDQPDLVLLVGGTDGGESEVLSHNAARLAAARLTARRSRIPVVVAGNAEVRDEAAAFLSARGTPVVVTGNVLPRIGVLDPVPARAAIREAFLRHVIGGKGLSRGPRFASLVRGATPDVVLSGVELLADELGGDLAAIDIGGATTDVYTVLHPTDAPVEDVAGTLWHARTVEGDLGMRWSAPGVVVAAAAERLPVPDGLVAAAARRAAHPDVLPKTDRDQGDEAALAELAAVTAVRRHARPDRNTRRDLHAVRLLVGSGGVLRYARPADADRVLKAILTDFAGGWPVPKRAAVVVDRDYLLAPAGLLAAEHPKAARALVRRLRSGSHRG